MSVGPPTAEHVASWMVDRVRGGRTIYQDEIVWDIQREFGDKFLYHNENGNLAIAKDVLVAFRKLTNDDVVWSRSERCWRRRKTWDKPGRQQE